MKFRHWRSVVESVSFGGKRSCTGLYSTRWEIYNPGLNGLTFALGISTWQKVV